MGTSMAATTPEGAVGVPDIPVREEWFTGSDAWEAEIGKYLDYDRSMARRMAIMMTIGRAAMAAGACPYPEPGRYGGWKRPDDDMVASCRAAMSRILNVARSRGWTQEKNPTQNETRFVILTVPGKEDEARLAEEYPEYAILPLNGKCRLEYMHPPYRICMRLPCPPPKGETLKTKNGLSFMEMPRGLFGFYAQRPASRAILEAHADGMRGNGEAYKWSKDALTRMLQRFIGHRVKQKVNGSSKDLPNDRYQEAFNESVAAITRDCVLARYDAERSMPTTFFAFYIQHALSEYFDAEYHRDSSRNRAGDMTRIRRAREDIEKQGLEATPEALAVHTGLPVHDVQTLVRAMARGHLVYVDEVERGDRVEASVMDDSDGDGEGGLLDAIQGSDDPYGAVAAQERKDVWQQAFSKLSDQERECLYMSVLGQSGDGDGRKSATQIGQMLGIPRHDAATIVASAKRKMREDPKLREYFGILTRRAPLTPVFGAGIRDDIDFYDYLEGDGFRLDGGAVRDVVIDLSFVNAAGKPARAANN